MSERSPDSDKTVTYSPLSVGEMVAHYRIVERIGAGGMGEVYLADDTKLGRQVALKVLSTPLASDREFVTRFIREAQAAARLNHPNIVHIYEIGEDKNRPFFAMEYIDGLTLGSHTRQNALSISKTIDLAIQIGEGLSKAHKMGVIHRDIKAANIVIDSDGRAKILDFGLAQLRGSDKITRTGSTIGTVAYMSPEQVLGKELDERSDIYSFGAVLYEMVTGTTPFRRDTDAATMHAITHERAEPLARYARDASDDLQRVIDRSLEKDPTTRYPSADAMLSDLRRLQRDLDPSRATPTPLPSIVPGKKKIAVLPFDNLGATEQEYFADGITDEISSRLARIADLGVISQSSALKYRKSAKTPSEIGRELGVSYLLTGSLRWDVSSAATKVRIGVRLINASDETYLWTETYDRTLDQIFALQSEIADSVSTALGVTLGDSKKKDTSKRPTTNLEAYDYFLRANGQFPRTVSIKSIREALRLYRKAIELDPDFANAHARIAGCLLTSYWFQFDRSEAVLRDARAEIDKAKLLAPDSDEVHLAEGYYHYYGEKNFDAAIEQFQIALRESPNRSDILAAIAFVQRRKGAWQDSIGNLMRACELDPQSPLLTSEAANTLAYLRRYEESRRYFNAALWLAPDEELVAFFKCLATLSEIGDPAESLKVIKRDIPKLSRSVLFTVNLIDLLLAHQGNDPMQCIDQTLASDQEVELGESFIVRGLLALRVNRGDLARGFFESAASFFEFLNTREENDEYLAFWALALAGLGKKEEALKIGRRCIELLPLTKDAVFGTVRLEVWLYTLVTVGELDEAAEVLEKLLSIPSTMSVIRARHFSLLAPLRELPRVQELLREK